MPSTDYTFYLQVKVLSFHYNTVLELFLVLAYIPFQASSGSILLYDAITGDLMINFQTPFTVDSVRHNLIIITKIEINNIFTGKHLQYTHVL